MAQDIHIRQSIVVRARPDVLYRLALEPRRRVRWDPNLARAEYEGGENTRLTPNVRVRFKFSRRLFGLSFTAKYGQLQAPLRGGWESVRHVGPFERLTQSWTFKAMPGGTEVTLGMNGRIGLASGRATEQDATAMALQACRDAGGSECSIIAIGPFLVAPP